MDARNFTYMFYGFAAVWLLLALYVVSLAMRESRLRRELDSVKRMLEPHAPEDGKTPLSDS